MGLPQAGSPFQGSQITIAPVTHEKVIFRDAERLKGTDPSSIRAFLTAFASYKDQGGQQHARAFIDCFHSSDPKTSTFWRTLKSARTGTFLNDAALADDADLITSLAAAIEPPEDPIASLTRLDYPTTEVTKDNHAETIKDVVSILSHQAHELASSYGPGSVHHSAVNSLDWTQLVYVERDPDVLRRTNKMALITTINAHQPAGVPRTGPEGLRHFTSAILDALKRPSDYHLSVDTLVKAFASSTPQPAGTTQAGGKPQNHPQQQSAATTGTCPLHPDSGHDANSCIKLRKLVKQHLSQPRPPRQGREAPPASGGDGKPEGKPKQTCEHCGPKSTHTTDRCWKLHPELKTAKKPASEKKSEQA